MLKWILILIVVAAAASLLGFPRLAGAATGARQLIAVALILFLLVILGIVVIARGC